MGDIFPSLFYRSMILLKKNSEKIIALTLNELAVDTLPFNWLFVFKKEQSQGANNDTYKIYLTDLSTTTNYNKFSITEGVDVTIRLAGDYTYSVYQMPDGGSTDESLGYLVENGLMRLLKEDAPINSYAAESNRVIYGD